MDILSQQSLKCKTHPNDDVVFLKVNDINNNDKIFYCETCIYEIDCFITSEFLRIKNIFQSDYQTILKWPPLDNTQIITQMKQLLSESDDEKNLNIQNEIIGFFDQLKNQIFEKIENRQKAMIRLVTEKMQKKGEKEQKKGENILKQLLNFSKIDVLQSILSSNKFDQLEKERQLREIINKAHFERQQNIEQITKILDQQNKFEIPLGINESILNLIDQINFFKIKTDQNILPDFELLNRPYAFNKQQYPKNLQIKRLHDNCIEIKCQKDDKQHFYSDQILQQDKKYVFRFQVDTDSFQDQFAQFGLIEDQIKNKNFLEPNEIIVFQQKFNNNKTRKFCSNTINKLIKGDLNKAKDVKTIEFRIDLQNQIVDVLDFPHYIHQLSIQDIFKKQLSHNNFRLFIRLDGSITFKLNSAFVCEQFQ